MYRKADFGATDYWRFYIIPALITGLLIDIKNCKNQKYKHKLYALAYIFIWVI